MSASSPPEASSRGWSRRGRLWEPPGPLPWARSHAALPALDPVGGDRYRLHVSARDERGRSSIARADVELAGGAIEVLGIDPEPVLGPGRPGAFDDAGATTSCVVADGERRLLFYTGWSLPGGVPFHLEVGLAVSDDGGETYARHSEGPLLGPDAVDPVLTASPFVLREDGRWRMWYVTGTGWLGEGETAEPNYRIAYAESADGLAWERDGTVAIDYGPGEHALSRPCVVPGPSGYRMWFSARGEAYRLRYAESVDGVAWRRGDAGLEPAAEGWDSEMVCYPWVVSHSGTEYLLYNGNGYGRSGIGYAVAEPG